MEYLNGAGFIHMDLAARNCLLHTQNVVKIADFGLTTKLKPGYQPFLSFLSPFPRWNLVTSLRPLWNKVCVIFIYVRPICSRALLSREDKHRLARTLKLPIAWMALESLESKYFTSKTDVWSFGITIWEIMS